MRLDSTSELGYASPLAMTSALKEWVRINIWAVTTVVNAAVYLCGGWDVVHRSSLAGMLHVLPFSPCRTPRTRTRRRRSG